MLSSVLPSPFARRQQATCNEIIRSFLCVFVCTIISCTIILIGLFYTNNSFKNETFDFVPTATPKLYQKGDRISLYVNKLTSPKSIIPLDYYRILPYRLVSSHDFYSNWYQKNSKRQSSNTNYYNYDNRNVPNVYPVNIGQRLLGECMRPLPFNNDAIIVVGTNMNCVEMGVAVLDYKIWEPIIRSNYYHNWIIDSKVLNPICFSFPVGSVKVYNDGKSQAAINNHFSVSITLKEVTSTARRTNNDRKVIEMQQEEDNSDYQPLYRITDFTVSPSSQPHYHDSRFEKIVPHCSMQSLKVESNMTDRTKNFRKTKTSWKKQVPNGPVMFTYDIVWTQQNRSDYDDYVYHATDKPSRKVILKRLLHLLTIESILLFVVFFSWCQAVGRERYSGFSYVTRGLPSVCSVKQKFNHSGMMKKQSRYSFCISRTVDEIRSFLQPNSRVLVAFRLSLDSPGLLAAFCGVWVQLLATTLVIFLYLVVLASRLHVTNAATLMTLAVYVYTACGWLGGYTSASLDYCRFAGSTFKEKIVVQGHWDALLVTSCVSFALRCFAILLIKALEAVVTSVFRGTSYGTAGSGIPWFHVMWLATAEIALSQAGVWFSCSRKRIFYTFKGKVHSDAFNNNCRVIIA